MARGSPPPSATVPPWWRTVKRVGNSRRVTAAVGLLVALALAAFAVAQWAKIDVLRDRGMVAEATVAEVHWRESWVKARFVTQDGRAVTAEVIEWHWDPEPRVGDRQTVLYDPLDPEFSVVDTRANLTFWEWLVPGLLLCGAAASLAFGIHWQRKYALSHGLPEPE